VSDVPETTVKQPEPVARPLAALQERLGITDEQMVASRTVGGEVFMGHREFEQQRYDDVTDCDGSLRIQDSSGLLWPCVCDVCGFEVGVQVQKIDPNRLLEHRLSKAGVPPEFSGKEFDKDDPDQQHTLQACRQWIRAFKAHHMSESIPSPALYGKAGRGKSHLLTLIVESLIKLYGVDALYWSSTELFDKLQAAIGEGTVDLHWQRVLRVPVLALDDLAAGRWTEFRQDRFSALVDYRYSHSLPLVIASNIPPPAWGEKFGERAASRLFGMTVRLELAGKDRRQNQQQSLMQGQA
jgi:DNA replication protein DnaC